MGGKNYPIKIPQHGVPEAQRDNAPDPRQSTPGHSGGSLRVFTVPARPGVPGQGGKAVSPRPERGAGRQFAWLEAGSGKVALSRSRQPAGNATNPGTKQPGLSAENNDVEKDNYMRMDELRRQISEFLRFSIPDAPVAYATQEVVEEHAYHRLRISYPSQEEDQIPAFLFLPDGTGPFAAVLVHHQHNSQRHLGKSEVCGLVGDSLQAFGPALVKRGIVVLAPDSICFEDRRRNRTGTEPDDADVEQHYNEMCYRLLQGDTLMHKVLSDSAQAISLLRTHSLVNPDRIGIMGHSYGGNTVLFHGALDERIRFACASGAACTYRYKMAHELGIEMAEVIPGFVTHYDIPELVACFAPRQVLLVSATNDKASQDADKIVAESQEICAAAGVTTHIEHQRYEGGHALTQERFDAILHWITQCAG